MSVLHCYLNKKSEKMGPRPKPSPHRLGPPPQLASLKVPVVQQKFAKKVIMNHPTSPKYKWDINERFGALGTILGSLGGGGGERELSERNFVV